MNTHTQTTYCLEDERLNANGLLGSLETPTRARRVRLYLAIVYVLSIAFYFYTANVGRSPLTPLPTSYYNKLTDSFLHGQLSLRDKPSPKLLNLADPYNPAVNYPYKLHDALLFRGNYYFYWGLSPVILLNAPIAFLTRNYITDAAECFVFASVGTAFYLLLLLQISGDWFKGSRTSTIVLLGVLMALGGMVPYLMNRPFVYEVAIASGYALTGAFFYFAYNGAFRERLRVRWIIAAGIALGLVFLSRPNLAACAIVMLTIVWLYRKPAHRPCSLPVMLLMGFAPLFIAIATQAWYNYLRFGSALEYGVKYQLAGVDVRHVQLFSATRSAFSLLLYAFGGVSYSPLFPFISLGNGVQTLIQPLRVLAEAISANPSPTLSFGTEPTTGVLVAVPALVLLVLTPNFVRNGTHALLSWFLVPVLITGLICAFVVAGVGPNERYELDFLPALILCACILLLWIEGRMLRSIQNRIYKWALFAAVAYTTLIAMLFSVPEFDAHSRYFAFIRLFAPLEMFLLHADRYPGPIQAVVSYPECKPLAQPLVTTGVPMAGDFISINCAGKPGTFVVAWDHWGATQKVGPQFQVPRRNTVVIDVAAPSLFAPITRDVAKALDVDTSKKPLCVVKVDGRVVFRDEACVMHSNAGHVSLFENDIGGSTTASAYTGDVVSIRQHREASY